MKSWMKVLLLILAGVLALGVGALACSVVRPSVGRAARARAGAAGLSGPCRGRAGARGPAFARAVLAGAAAPFASLRHRAFHAGGRRGLGYGHAARSPHADPFFLYLHCGLRFGRRAGARLCPAGLAGHGRGLCGGVRNAAPFADLLAADGGLRTRCAGLRRRPHIRKASAHFPFGTLGVPNRTVCRVAEKSALFRLVRAGRRGAAALRHAFSQGKTLKMRAGEGRGAWGGRGTPPARGEGIPSLQSNS